jgi:hypothetical protein
MSASSAQRDTEPVEELAAVASVSEWTSVAVNSAPPWLVSMVTHMLAFIILGLLFFPEPRRVVLDLEAHFADRSGEQLEVLAMEVPAVNVAVADERDVTTKLPEVAFPVAAPRPLDAAERGTSPLTLVETPAVGLALSGREEGMKRLLVKAYGGTAATETAVMRGLEWLKRQQRRSGQWSLTGPYANGAPIDNPEAATAMALLAFQGAGHTHRRGDYHQIVRRGWGYLEGQQNEQGSFFQTGARNHRFYTHAMATIAACELFGITRDEALREPAQRAVEYLVRLQDALGGWRYEPGTDSDTSVTGWVVMALHSARMAGLIVPSETFDRVSDYLDLAATDDGTRYGYRPGHADSLSMTAEGLLCRQYLGWKQDDPRLIVGTRYLLEHPIDYREPNVYYWYYATQVVHHMEGDYWHRWNRVMRELLPERQETVGKERGSWPPQDDRWGEYGGRLFTTCLSVYMLEVYYRHLPIYSPAYRYERR